MLSLPCLWPFSICGIVQLKLPGLHMGREKTHTQSTSNTRDVQYSTDIAGNKEWSYYGCYLGFTYLHHPDQPLAHSSVSSYQRLYSPASNKVHSCTSSLSATFSSRYRPVDRGAQQLGQLTGPAAFQVQQQAAKAHNFTQHLEKVRAGRIHFVTHHQTLQETHCHYSQYRISVTLYL